MASLRYCLVASCLAGFLLVAVVVAHPEFQARIPNGARVMANNGVSWPGVGHGTPAGGTFLNPFGLKFRSAGFQWTLPICLDDADGDGWTNGAELGDPACTWSSTSSNTTQRNVSISHPGFPDVTPLSLLNATGVGELTITGYLVDRLCADRGISLDGVNVTSQVYLHSVRCLTMAPCVSSGYTIFVENVIDGSISGPSSRLINYGNISSYSNNSHRFVWAYNLTDDGAAMATMLLATMPPSRRNVLLSFTGTIDEQRQFDPSSIQDLSPSSMSLSTVVGYLADIFCVNLGVALDGTNMTHAPYKHTVSCELMGICQTRGYTLLVDVTDGTLTTANSPLIGMSNADVAALNFSTQSFGVHAFKPVVNLTSDSTPKVLKFLRSLPPTRNNLLVSVQGVMTSAGLLDVATITDLTPNTLPVVTVTGFVSDLLCWNRGTSLEGTNMTYEPFKHTAKCNLMSVCIASGYTLLIPSNWSSGNSYPTPSDFGNVVNKLTSEFSTSDQQLYKSILNFSSSANGVIVSWLRKWPASKTNLLVTLTGFFNTNGTFDIITLSSASPRLMFTGILTDQYSVVRGLSVDGVDMFRMPFQQRVSAQLAGVSLSGLSSTAGAAAGFTLLIDTNATVSFTDVKTSPFISMTSVDVMRYTGNSTVDAARGLLPLTGHTFVPSYNFTKYSNKWINGTFLQGFINDRRNMMVQFIGTLTLDSISFSNGVLEAESLRDIVTRDVVTGYLTDVYCANRGKDFSGNDLTKKAWLHSTSCQLMPVCSASGFAVMVDWNRKASMTDSPPTLTNLSDAQVQSYSPPSSSPLNPNFGIYYNLTSASSQLVLSFLVNQPSTRRNLLVTLTGKVMVDSNGVETFDLETLVDASPLSATWIGYVADIRCVTAGVAPDGTNMTSEPYKHTRSCALMPACVASGFTLLYDRNPTGSYTATTSPLINLPWSSVAGFNATATTGAPRLFSRSFDFSENSNRIIVRWLINLPERRNNHLVALTGAMLPNLRGFEIVSFTDLSPRTAFYTGYAADRLCVDNGISFDGVNMTFEPYKHSATCALMSSCRSSGYTLLVDTNTTASLTDVEVFQSPLVNRPDRFVANFTIVPLHRFIPYINFSFATGGNEKIASLLSSFPILRNNLLIKVFGAVNVWEASGTVDVLEAIDLSPLTTQLLFVEGYISDAFCFNAGLAADGANMTFEPYKHTVRCSLMPQCVASGFVLLVDTDAIVSYTSAATSPLVNKSWPEVAAFPLISPLTHRFVRAYTFSATANARIVSWLRSLPPSRNNLFVRIGGEINANGHLDIRLFTDLSPMTLPLQTTTGIVTDLLSFSLRISSCGAVNMTFEPYKYTAGCLLQPASVSSGFVLLADVSANPGTGIISFTDSLMSAIINKSAVEIRTFRPAEGLHRFSIRYNLSALTNDRVITFASQLPPSRSVLLVQMTGAIVNGKFEVAQIFDLSPSTSPVVSVVGYIADWNSLGPMMMGLDPAGNNLTVAPYRYTTKSALTAVSQLAGYTVLQDLNQTVSFTNQSGWSPLVNMSVANIANFIPDATHYFNASLNFTEDGNKKVQAFLRALPIFRNNLLVKISGGMIAPGLLDITNLEDLSANTSPFLTVIGILTDRRSFEQGLGADGVNMTAFPFRHTARTASMAAYAASGFGILVDQNSTNSLTTTSSPLINLRISDINSFTGANVPSATWPRSFKILYNFTAESNVKALDWLNSLLPGRNNLLVSLRGAVAPTGELDVLEIIDLSPVTGPSVTAISQGIVKMFSGINGGGILFGTNVNDTSMMGNLSAWTTLTGKRICQFDGVGYACDFTSVRPRLAGLMDFSQLPQGISRLVVDNQNVEGVLDLSPSFFSSRPFLKTFVVSRNALLGLVGPNTFRMIPSSLEALSIAFNLVQGPLTIEEVPSTLMRLDVSGNNLTTGLIRVHTLPEGFFLSLDRSENSNDNIRRRFTTYTSNTITTVSWLCGGSNPSLDLLLSNGTYVYIRNGTIPTHCANCSLGVLYNVVDAACPPLNDVCDGNVLCSSDSSSNFGVATPVPHINTTYTLGSSRCDRGCVAVIVVVILLLIALVVAGIVTKFCCKPMRPKKEAASLDEGDIADQPPQPHAASGGTRPQPPPPATETKHGDHPESAPAPTHDPNSEATASP